LAKWGLLGEEEILETGGVSGDSAVEPAILGDASAARGDRGGLGPSVLDWELLSSALFGARSSVSRCRWASCSSKESLIASIIISWDDAPQWSIHSKGITDLKYSLPLDLDRRNPNYRESY
jgi:hypothetical protein